MADYWSNFRYGQMFIWINCTSS